MKSGRTTTSELRITLKKKPSQGYWWSGRSGESIWKSESVGFNTRRLGETLRSRPFSSLLSSSTVCLPCLALCTALTGPGNIGGQVALMRGGQCDLLSSGGDGSAALGDTFDGHHALFDIVPLLLGGSRAPPPPPSPPPHH